MTKEEIAKKIAELKQVYYRHGGHVTLKAQFDELLAERRAELAMGVVQEARGIALLGASGSGKTSAVARLFNRHPDLLLPTEGSETADVISFKVPSPATLKNVGKEALTALGYPLERERSAAITFGLVKSFLRKREVKFLHIDEVQDLYTSNSANVRQSVINTFKSLMQHPEWPVSLILSGMPDVREMLNADPQLSRRMRPITLARLSYTADEAMLRDILGSYLSKAGLRPSAELMTQDTLSRLLHSGAYEFGMVIEVIIEAIREAYKAGAEALEVIHFAQAMRLRVGCYDGMNPFIAPDYLHIDPRNLLPNQED